MSDLIEKLRECPGECDCTLGSQAADALEAKDQRIAELEADLELATARYGVAQMRIEQFEARYNKNEIKWQNIASGQLRRTEQLEAALRQIIDYHDIGGEHVITCQRIAKQALKGDNDDTV